jgi:hypothetical protein
LVTVLQLFLGYQSAVLQFEAALFQVALQFIGAGRIVEVHSKLQQYLIECVVLLLHLLVVAAALLCLAGGNEGGHILKYFICSSEILENEVATVNL